MLSSTRRCDSIACSMHRAIDAADEPARLGPAFGRGRIAGEHAVFEVGGGDAFGEIGLASAKGVRDANGDGLFDGIGGPQRRLAEAGYGVVFDGGGRRVLRFHRHRLRVRRLNENVGPQARTVGKDSRPFDAQTLPPLRVLAAQDLGKATVEDRLAGAWHAGFPRNVARPARTGPRPDRQRRPNRRSMSARSRDT